MKKQTRTILQELNNLNLTGDKDRLIETTANNIINSIKNGDPKKFKRGIDKIIESKK